MRLGFHVTSLCSITNTFCTEQVNDGSSTAGLQVVVTDAAAGYEQFVDGRISTGAAVTARGELVKSPGGKQSVGLIHFAQALP